MTRRRLLALAIEAIVTPHNLVPGPDDPPVLKVMSFEEFSHLQTEEIVRIESKIVERIEQLFRHYSVARTGEHSGQRPIPKISQKHNQIS
jgi:hypothetical protein